MKTKLDQLLDRIHPSRTLEEVEARADEAVNSFHWTAGTITHWDDFKGCLMRFLSHMETGVLRLRGYPDMSPDFSWGRCVHVLLQEYGMNGEKAAFEMARTGAEGGLYAVLKAIAKRIAAQYAGNEVSARILTFWNGLSVDEKLDAAAEYLDKYGHLLPTELTEGSAARLRANFPKVLEEHPRLLRRLGRIGR